MCWLVDGKNMDRDVPLLGKYRRISRDPTSLQALSVGIKIDAREDHFISVLYSILVIR
jgi:hypothetical protein